MAWLGNGTRVFSYYHWPVASHRSLGQSWIWVRLRNWLAYRQELEIPQTHHILEAKRNVPEA